MANKFHGQMKSAKAMPMKAMPKSMPKGMSKGKDKDDKGGKC